MCQLILVNMGSPVLNRLFLTPLLQIDSIGNGDGTGWLAVDKGEYSVFKSKESASQLDDLGLDVRAYVTSKNPVLAHVRAASKGIDVEEKNAHPFQGERFVLAHNGRLYPKEEKVTYNATDNTSSTSDSLIFLKRLEKDAKKNPELDFPTLLNNTMKEFKGKFALLIYDSLTNIHYVIRGTSADLHMMKVKRISMDGKTTTEAGYIVNTRKNSLSDAVDISVQIVQTVMGDRLAADTIVELDKNTIYRVDKDELVKVGDIPENAIVYESSYVNNRNFGESMGGLNSEINTIIPVWTLPRYKRYRCHYEYLSGYTYGRHNCTRPQSICRGGYIQNIRQEET
jgi:predicted glutamine amidotransferase